MKMIKKLFTIVSLVVMCIMTAACITYDGKIPMFKPETESTNPVEPVSDPIEQIDIHIDAATNSVYHVEPLDDMVDVPLVELHADWADIPVYAVMASDGELMLYTNAHEENMGLRGMLSVSIQPTEQDPIILVDYDSGFANRPDFAFIDICDHTNDGYIVSGTLCNVNETPALYYIIYNSDNEQIGAVPVSENYESEITVRVTDDIYMFIYKNNDAIEEIQPEEPTSSPVNKTEVPAETEEPMLTPEPTKEPDATQKPQETAAATSKPTATAKPTAKPTATAKPSNKPTATPKPTNTPKPTPTPKPTATPGATPTPHVWTCKYCGKVFGSTDADYEAWYQHAWYNPGCYQYGHAVTPVPATPTPRPGGHYEDVWVVDVPRISHTVWHCNVCGWENDVWETFRDHQHEHVKAGEGSGYHSYIVVDQEEQGHWETIWVPDP